VRSGSFQGEKRDEDKNEYHRGRGVRGVGGVAGSGGPDRVNRSCGNRKVKWENRWKQ